MLRADEGARARSAALGSAAVLGQPAEGPRWAPIDHRADGRMRKDQRAPAGSVNWNSRSRVAVCSARRACVASRQASLLGAGAATDRWQGGRRVLAWAGRCRQGQSVSSCDLSDRERVAELCRPPAAVRGAVGWGRSRCRRRVIRLLGPR
jgi:hypothetical protein